MGTSLCEAVYAMRKSMAGSVLSGAGQLLTAQAALPGLGYAASMPIPALAQGAVIPPNRRFLAMLGDQTGGTNVEAPPSCLPEKYARRATSRKR